MMDISRWVTDFSWMSEEAGGDNGMGGRQFYVFNASRGNVFTYPTSPTQFSDYYSREEACKNATIAACVPMILRDLASLHEHIGYWTIEDPDCPPDAEALLSKCKQFRREIEDIFAEIERLTAHNLAKLMPP